MIRSLAVTRVYWKYDSGNVGIGTTSPSAKLHIAGTSAVLRVGAATDASVVEIEPNRLPATIALHRVMWR